VPRRLLAGSARAFQTVPSGGVAQLNPDLVNPLPDRVGSGEVSAAPGRGLGSRRIEILGAEVQKADGEQRLRARSEDGKVAGGDLRIARQLREDGERLRHVEAG
jgi:hypothetical protein